MVRLSFQEESGRREVVLKPGTNNVGRLADNDVVISDGSVSKKHCQIEVHDWGLLVRDLGSTNGTFVDSHQVTEAAVKPRQTLKLGSVEVFFEGAGQASTAAKAKSAPVRLAMPASSSSSQTTMLARPETKPSTPMPPPMPQSVAGRAFTKLPLLPGQRPGFASYVGGAFLYPLKKNGILVLVLMMIIMGFLELAQRVVFGFVYWLALIMSVGYTFAFMQNIVYSTAKGEDEMPDLPEITDFKDDIFWPGVRYIMIFVLSLAPGFAAIFFVNPLVGIALVLLGAFCLPMSLLSVAVADSIGGINPIVIFSGIAKTFLSYLVICIISLFLLGLAGAVSGGVSLVAPEFVASLAGVPFMIYSLSVTMRLLGSLYYTNEHRLGWL